MRVAATALWAALIAAHDVRAAADGSDDSPSALVAKHYIVEYETVSEAVLNPSECRRTECARAGGFSHGA